MLEKVERFVFFPVVRLAAFIGASVLFLAIISGFIFILAFKGIEINKVNISFSELQAQISPEKIKNKEQIKIPNNLSIKSLEKYFGEFEEYAKQQADDFNQFLKELSKDKLKNLSKIVAEAEKKDSQNIVKYLWAYAEAYYENLDEQGKIRGLLGNTITTLVNQFITSAIKGIVVFVLLFLFVLFMIIIVLLLLLSIERNTRKEPIISTNRTNIQPNEIKIVRYKNVIGADLPVNIKIDNGKEISLENGSGKIIRVPNGRHTIITSSDNNIVRKDFEINNNGKTFSVVAGPPLTIREI